jgi:ABC-type nitrate/sulfonate/bicarbonate transport system substrate-binding protein
MKKRKACCRKSLLAITLAALAECGLSLPAFAADEVKLHINGLASVNASIFQIAEKKGFYRTNDLQVLQLVAASQAGIQGLIGGSFDASMILGLGSAAILRGAPLRIVMSFDVRPVYYLFGAKDIRNVQDLKGGKRIGVSGLGAMTDQITREVLSKNGLNPQRDVSIHGTGTGSVRMLALMGGGLDAAIFNSVEALTAKKQGLHELLFYGDYDLNIISGGVVVGQRTLTERRDVLRRFLRGTLQAFHWIKSNEIEAAALAANNFKLSKNDTAEVFRATLKAYTQDGTVPIGQQERIIEFQKKQLQIEGHTSPSAVYDFSLLRSLNQELKRAGS